LLWRNPEGFSYFLDEHHVPRVGWSVHLRGSENTGAGEWPLSNHTVGLTAP
jgi:hypothetical protein